MRARRRALRRLSARRSSSLSPPHTPESWPVSKAHRKQSSTTGQRRQTALASSIWTKAGPVLPIGKNNSGSSSRQAASWRQSMRDHSICADALGLPALVNALTRWLPLGGEGLLHWPTGEGGQPVKTRARIGSQTLASGTRANDRNFVGNASFTCRMGHISPICTICPFALIFSQGVNHGESICMVAKLNLGNMAKGLTVNLNENFAVRGNRKSVLVVPARVSVC